MPELRYSSYTPTLKILPLSIFDPAVSYWYSSESIKQLLLSLEPLFTPKRRLCSGLCSGEEGLRGAAHICRPLHCELVCLSNNTGTFSRKALLWGNFLWSLLFQAGEGLEHLKVADFVTPLIEWDSYQFNGKNRRETLATGKILRSQMLNGKTTILFFCVLGAKEVIKSGRTSLLLRRV